MNYSDLSDFEINQLVAVALGAKEHCRYEMGERSTVFYELNGGPIDVRKGFKGMMNCLFDPCNDPKSAWPIIVANRISITPYEKSDQGWFATPDSSFFVDDANPLKAAMIVYLMMQGKKA
jgi:hypothetical protein